MEKPDARSTSDHAPLEDNLALAIRQASIAAVLTDPHQADNPIIFANDAFVELSGYAREEVIGRNCRFLQGPQTDRSAVVRLKQAIAEGVPIDIELLNYRKDGSTFWNGLSISPLFDELGAIALFFAIQIDCTRRGPSFPPAAEASAGTVALEQQIAELQSVNARLAAEREATQILLHEADHRIKNNLQMMSSLLGMQSRNAADAAIRASLDAARLRVEALGAVHRRLRQVDDAGVFDVAELAHDLLTALVQASGRFEIATKFELEPVELGSEKAAAVALIINELVTNALKHAFPAAGQGSIFIRIGRQERDLSIIVTDDGRGMRQDPALAKSFGTTLVRSLSRQLGATVAWTDLAPGTRVEVKISLAEEEG